MAIKVRLSTPLRSYAAGRSVLEVAGGSLSDIIERLEADHPGLGQVILDDRGQVQRFVKIWVDGDDAAAGEGLCTRIDDGTEVAIMLAVAGG